MFHHCFVTEMQYVIWSLVLYRYFDTRVVLQRVYIYSFLVLFVRDDDLITYVIVMLQM